MKLIKLLAVLAILFVIGGFILPKDYSVSRTVLINGEKPLIHEYVGDLDKWPEWSPWEKADSSIVVYPGDSSSGMGASQRWKGDSGSGWLQFTDTSEEDGIKYDVIFDEQDKAKAAISYRGIGDMTEVTWSMKGRMEYPVILAPYIAMSMDMIVGRLFKQGLDDLKKTVEDQNI
jgi:hypothetical protein